MTGKPINLNRVRKDRARADAKAKAKADENAVAFGRTKAEKDLAQARLQKAKANQEHHKRDT